METTQNKYAAAVIGRIIADAGYGTQAALAAACRLSNNAVSRHLAGERAITTSHITHYLRGIPADHRRPLLRAWLRDQVDRDIDEILGPGAAPARIQETDPATDPHARLIDWLRLETLDDPELHTALATFARRMGWRA